MVKKFPKRGEIWWIKAGSSTGRSVQKDLLAVIISNNISNSVLDRYQVVPLTSNTEKIFPSECKILFRKKKGKAMTDQILTVHASRLTKRGGEITDQERGSLEDRLRLQLDL